MAKKQSTSVLKFDDVKVIWRTIIQNWYVPIVLVPIFYLIGYFIAYRQLETYQVSTQLLLKNNDQYAKGSLVSENDYYGGISGSYIDNSNETRVITSFDLIEKVIDKLKSRLQVSYYIVGRVRTKEEFGGMPFSILVNSVNASFFEKPISFKILSEKTYEISYKEGDKEIKQRGVFGKELITINYDLLISADAMTAVGINERKNIQYEFKIHSLE
ncbi:MAG: Wzz/FepE/Etk N-terminal domain-containing protein, partial [Bacteroidia bacterium]